MRTFAWLLAAIALARAPHAAAAPADENAAAPDADLDADLGHRGQFGLRAGLVAGYRMIFRYDESPYCSEPDPSRGSLKDQQKFCGHTAPLALDLAASFAPLDFIEPYAWIRLGLAGEDETNTDPVLAFGVGTRVYTMSDSRFKIFIEPAIAVETESGGDDPAWRYGGLEPDYKTDLLIHLAAGPQFDIARYVGVYATAGLTTGILRYIHTGLELNLGVQVRGP